MTHRIVPRVALALPAVLAIAVAAVSSAVHAQADFPNRPIRLIVPFPPGGGTDFVSRVIAASLGEHAKWQVVPDNKPGAAGNLAIAEAARAAPDGYTLVMGQSDNMMLGPYLYKDIGYDTVKSFAPIVQVSEAPLAIVSNAAPADRQMKIATVADMVSKGKTASGLTWATAGNGSVGHLYGEQLKSAAAINLLQVPYKGASPGLNDLMVGSVDVAIMSVPSVLPLVRGGKLTPVAVTTSRRSAQLPDTPTVAEAGIKGIDTGIWLGLFAPAGTPPAIVARINAEVNRVLQLPDVREKIAYGGAVAAGGASDDFAKFVAADYAKWGKAVKESGVTLE